MPFNSYPELASAATWFPAPVIYLSGYDDLTTLQDLQHVSWCFRGITLTEGRPDIDGVTITLFAVGQARLAAVQVRQSALDGVTVGQAEAVLSP